MKESAIAVVTTMDFFQQESFRLRALADADPSPERLAQVREALASKYQGIQHLGASVLAAWIRRARRTSAPVPRPKNGRKPCPKPETKWVDLLGLWTLSILSTWGQSLSYSSRLITSFVGFEDLDWICDLYSCRGRHCDVSDIRLPDACVARLKLIAASSSSWTASYEAERWLRKFDWEGKYDPHPRDVERPALAEQFRRKGLGRRRRGER
jgi:hypothetical protein